MKLSPFIMLCSAGLFAIFSSTISKSPVLPLFATHLGADPAGVGFIAAVSAFTGIIASIPAGLFSDRFGRKRMLVFSLLIFSTAPFLYPLATKLWHLALIRFYHGFATAIFVPVGMALVADLFHEERGERLGWFSTATLAGRFMAPLAGGSIIGAMVFNPGLSYKVVYFVCGGAGVIAFLLTLGISSPAKERKEKKSWDETVRAFKAVISSRTILLTCTVEAAILFAYGTFETFLPLYSIQKGLTAYHIGIFLSAQVFTLALTKPLMGRFSDRHGRRPQIFAGAVIGAVCIGSFSLFTMFLPLLVLSILFGLSLSLVTSATSAFIADLSRQETHGSAMGVLGSIMDIGHTTGPLASGIVAAYLGVSVSFLSAAFVLFIAAVIFRVYVKSPVAA
ncbi:MAG: MFS transporter [Thermodesulfovibrionales bacterium]|nr:MFS transporter [Thermodesulfovibrionales bacterium]